MINKTIIIALLFFFSCTSKRNIIIYKDTQTIDFGHITNSIYDFKRIYGDTLGLDSLYLNKKQSKELYEILNNLENKKDSVRSFNTPRYAFILDYNNRKDTLYFYDFNSEFYKKEGYLIQNGIKFYDKDLKFKNFMLENYKVFVEKEYYGE